MSGWHLPSWHMSVHRTVYPISKSLVQLDLVNGDAKEGQLQPFLKSDFIRVMPLLYWPCVDELNPIEIIQSSFLYPRKTRKMFLL